MEQLSRILVPVTGSDTSDRAVDMAVGLSKATGAALDILFVSYFDSSTDGADDDSWLPEGVAGSTSHEIDAVLNRARCRIPSDVSAVLHHRIGTPAKEILSFLKTSGVGMVIVGGRGLGIVEGFLMGSVSQEILESAPCAVVIVK